MHYISQELKTYLSYLMDLFFKKPFSIRVSLLDFSTNHIFGPHRDKTCLRGV